MYDDTILPVRSKFRVPSRSQKRIYFVQDKTKESLFFIKWIELIMCLISLCFIILTINVTKMPKLDKILIVSANSSSILMVLAEITYPYLKRSLPVIFQVLCSGTNFSIFAMVTALIYQIENNHELIKTLFFLNGFAAVLFLVDFICRILISTYLYQTTRVKSVVDVAVSTIFPPSSTGSKSKTQPHRSILTATPITYGGTFPIGKNQPPFLPEERIPPNDGCQTPERGTRNKTMQIPSFMEIRDQTFTSVCVGTCYSDKNTKSKTVQTYLENERVYPPHVEGERRKKSPWTCSTPTSSKKFEARKQASMSTPITYSGTFAVNRELVPFTPNIIGTSSPKSSPRSTFHPDKPGRKIKDTPSSRSEGNSPVRLENMFLQLERLDHISEEKISQMSSENCSVKKSNCTFFDSSILPGSVVEENNQYYRKNINYFLT